MRSWGRMKGHRSLQVYSWSKSAPRTCSQGLQLHDRMTLRLGLRDELHIVAYDDESGGRASRLVWTLYLLGYRRASVLNGGIHTWLHDGCPVTRTSTTVAITNPIPLAIDESIFQMADREKARTYFNVSPDEVVALYVGRLSLRQKVDFAPILEMLSPPISRGVR